MGVPLLGSPPGVVATLRGGLGQLVPGAGGPGSRAHGHLHRAQWPSDFRTEAARSALETLEETVHFH